MKTGIIGTGAVGGFYGGLLAKNGNDVHFLLNSDYEHVKANGLRIDSELLGKIHLPHVNVYRTSNEMPSCDIILVCLKTLMNQSLLPDILPPLLKDESIVILVQNGLGIEAELSHIFPEISIAGGLAFIASNKTGPGHIRHIDQGHINIGNYNVKDTSMLLRFVDILNDAGIKTRYSDDLPRLRWRKLVWNIAFNGTTVVLNATTDQLLQQPESRQLLKDLMLEVIYGAQACGVDLDERFADEQLALTDTFHAYKPSMKLDYDRKRPMEIRYIYDYPVMEAFKHGFEMKKVKLIADQLYFLQSGMSV
ncbi:MAG: putative 2-dehydropantoate 2-reductase [Tannerella sp.]|jgi:2-dehydropantoate 2-reductase|nr:putative 2-dehydropantoate 2-reductase [Tannerella sp.]